MTTFDRLRAILIRDYKLTPDRLPLTAPLEQLGLDSLATTELLFTLEETFEVTLPTDVPRLHTLGDVVRLIDELVAPPQPVASAPGAAVEISGQ